MSSLGFEPAIPADEWLQTRAVACIGLEGLLPYYVLGPELGGANIAPTSKVSAYITLL